MAAKDSHRVLLLEEEVRTLSEELVQCQADKEFVWSLWKRLQVANPDLTQAVSLVVEREKQKGEAKDRKVLQILQVKDYKIQELEQRVTSQQQELKEKSQELEKRSQELKEKSQELKACREQSDCKEAGLRDVVAELEEAKAGLEEEKAGLEDHLARMQDDLEKLLERAEVWSQEKSDFHTKAEVLEGELTEAKDQIEALHEKCSSLTNELAAVGKELEQSYEHVARLKEDLQQLQSLYTQSVEHASDQAQLIKQLEDLNLETQRVLRTQEVAHSADSVSYQRLYSDLNETFQALKASEGQLRQAQIALTSQLHQKEQEILRLQAQLEQRVSTVSAACSPVPQSNCGRSEERTKRWSVRRECVNANASPFDLSLTPSRDVQTNLRTSQGASVQRSRSLSPTSGRKGAFGALQRAEARVRDLEELLHLKMEESAELKRAHENRQERLHVLQNNCGALREQLKQAEEAQVLPKGKRQRAQPWELRQEDSDGVWNELAHFKRLSKNLATEKMNLEEEVDVLRVQAAVDRVALQEMRLFLQQERDELLQREAEGAGGTPEIPSTHTPQTPPLEETERTAQQIEELQNRAWSLEKEVEFLKEANRELSEDHNRLQRRAGSLEKEAELLTETNRELLDSREELQAAMLRLHGQTAARQQADRAWHQGVVQEVEQELGGCRRELAQARRDGATVRQQLERARRELGLLRAARDYRSCQRRRKMAQANASCAQSLQKRKQRLRYVGEAPPKHARTNKDGWEDVSAESDSSEEYSDSLNTPLPPRTQSMGERHSRDTSDAQHALQPGDCNDVRPEAATNAQPGCMRPLRPWPQRRRRGPFSRALQQRIAALQQQVSALQAAKKAAQSATKELQLAQERSASQLSALTQKANASKQLSQKLTSDLAATEQRRGDLERELEELKRRPPQTPAQGPEPQNTAEAELKALQAKLKSACAEVTKHTAAIKTLKTELQAKEEQVKALQEKVSHLERDVNMKRQLAEDLRNKTRTLQDNDRSLKTQNEDLDRKVRVLSEEAANRKAFIDSLKRRLAVATREKNECEDSSHKLRKQLEKKDQKAQALHAQVMQCETAMAELERTASQQMHGLAQQSTQALDALQTKLGVTNTQLEHFQAFVQALAGELHSDMQEAKAQLRKHRRRKLPEGSRQSQESLRRAQCLAASILNVSPADLQDIMDPDKSGEEAEMENRRDQDWLDQVMKLLQQQMPSVSLLLEAMRSKLRERTVLIEELASLKTHASDTPDPGLR